MCGRNSRAGPPRETMIPNFSNRDQQKRRNANFIDLHPPPKRERIFSNRRVVFRTSVERGFSGEGSNVFATNDKRRFRFFLFLSNGQIPLTNLSLRVISIFHSVRINYCIFGENHITADRGRRKRRGGESFFNLKFRLPIDNCR